jgi:aspartyl aminopeptidase
MKLTHINDLMKFLDASPTSYQAAEQLETRLLSKGFTKLDETQEWKLKTGGKYFVARNQSAVIAFALGKKKPNVTGFRMAAAHLDSPLLKIKSDAVKQEKNYTKLFVELYGAPIISTWLDRELSIAGRVMVKTTDKITKKTQYISKLVNLAAPIAIIPNAAIHLNREVNKGFEYNAQNHLTAIMQATGKDGKFKTLKEVIADAIQEKVQNIGEMDLFLYDPTPAHRIGNDAELLISGRLDNLAMSHAIGAAVLEGKSGETTRLAIFYDHEEIGSSTPSGADSSFTSDILQRINLALGLTPEQMLISYRKSFLVSTDMAHAVHPNFAEKHDSAYVPMLNHGPVIKINASQRYATTAESCACFEAICEQAGVPCQKIINRSDVPSGSTIGPIVSAKLSLKTIDIGNPMLAMHSIRETMGVYDHEYMIKALTGFYE